MTEHTPTPWTPTQNSWQYTTIYDAEGRTICRLDLEDWGVTEDNQDALEKAQALIAAFIVKAVNNHDALVAVVQQLLGAYDAGSLQLSSPEIGEPENDIPLHPWHEELLHHARQALNAVVGGSR